MNQERFVVLGIAPARSTWLQAVNRWANSGALAVEFIKCISLEELLARLAAGRQHSAVLIDEHTHGFDRDVVAQISAAGCVPLAVTSCPGSDRLRKLGIDATLVAPFTLDELEETLEANAARVKSVDSIVNAVAKHDEPDSLGSLIAVTGPGGTGASTIAIALSQGLASLEDRRSERRHDVVLVDCCRHADQAVIHNTGDVMPGLPDLVEISRLSTPSSEICRCHAFHILERKYDLLLGLRRPTAWTSIKPRSFETALASIRASWKTVVADIDSDFEGETDTGSIDVEERNTMARTVSANAAALIVVGTPGLKGTYALGRLIAEAATHGVEPQRILPVIVDGPKSPRGRSQICSAMAVVHDHLSTASPLFVSLKKTELVLRDGMPLAREPSKTLARAAREVIGRSTPASTSPIAPIAPGSLGNLLEEELAG